MVRYVLGFAFTKGLGAVLLLNKKRPARLAGKLNGIGGHIEPGEEPLDAMRREFREESGLVVNDWTPVAVLDGSAGGELREMHVFATFEDRIFEAQSMTDEEVEVAFLELQGALDAAFPNVPWLVAMSKMVLTSPRPVQPYLVTEGPAALRVR
jgi:8-oxo-dGTP diphosphatase